MQLADPSLLISDDDLNFRETLESVFAPRGFRILLASDGEEALDIVRTQVVHLALLDMHMPKLTGLETLRLVKQYKAMLPCILMSAQWDDLLMEQAQSAHAFLVLPKTISLRQITGAVWQALERTYSWRRPIASAPLAAKQPRQPSRVPKRGEALERQTPPGL